MDRILVISDIHGHASHLERALQSQAVDFSADRDQLVLLGDYIDRGPNSLDTVALVRSLVTDGAVALKGNHEHMATTPEDRALWLYNGGDATLANYGTQTIPEEDYHFLSQLPLLHTTDHHIFVHAGVSFNKELEEQDEWDLLWTRERFIDWHYPEGGKTIVFGHTATSLIRLALFPEMFSLQTLDIHDLYAPIYPSEWFGNRIAVDANVVESGFLCVVDVVNHLHWEIW